MFEKLKKCISDKLRMSHWLVMALALYIVAAVLSTMHLAQLSTIAWKVGHLTVAAHVGYWVDREAFKFSRLSEASTDLQELRRAIVIGCAMLAVAMGM